MLFPIRSRVGAALGAAVLVALVASAALGVACKRDPSPAASGPQRNVFVQLKPSAGELDKLLPAEVAKANAQQLRPFVEIGAEWCKPCKQLEASMNDARMKDAFNGTYVIRLDVDDWSSSLSTFDLEPTVIPVVFEIDAHGKSTGRSINGNDWGATIPENVAPLLKAFFAKK
jgi:thiol-disulfide isomerase/thioredoxin